MTLLHCSCCGEEITAPKWNNNLPYGWRCFEKLFSGQTQKNQSFKEVSLVKIIRKWISEGNEKYLILFKLNGIKLAFPCDHGITFENKWFVPEAYIKTYLKEAKKNKVI